LCILDVELGGTSFTSFLQESGLLQPHEEQSLRDMKQEAEAEADSESGTDDDHVVEAAEENVGCEAPW